MKANSPINETVIANALVAILERLERLEEATNILAGRHLTLRQRPPTATSPDVEQAVLMQRLEKLTLKRHAALTAALGGVGYAKLAEWMQCDETTVKLHLKGALKVLDIPTRTLLLARHPKLLEFIPDDRYKARFGLSKTWWLDQEANLMAVLTRTKAAKNQYIGSETGGGGRAA
jgi:hypothetical protein